MAVNHESLSPSFTELHSQYLKGVRGLLNARRRLAILAVRGSSLVHSASRKEGLAQLRPYSSELRSQEREWQRRHDSFEEIRYKMSQNAPK